MIALIAFLFLAFSLIGCHERVAPPPPPYYAEPSPTPQAAEHPVEPLHHSSKQDLIDWHLSNIDGLLKKHE